MTLKEDLLYEISWKSYDGVMIGLKNLRALSGFIITADGFLLILFSNSIFFSSISTSGKVWIFQILGICLSVSSVFLSLGAIHFSRGINFNLSDYYEQIKGIDENELKSFFTERIVSNTKINKKLFEKSNFYLKYSFLVLALTIGLLAGYITAHVIPFP